MQVLFPSPSVAYFRPLDHTGLRSPAKCGALYHGVVIQHGWFTNEATAAVHPSRQLCAHLLM